MVAGSPVLGSAVPIHADGNVRAMVGKKNLASDDWASIVQQAAFGVLFDIKQAQWPVSLVAELFASGADSDNDDISRKRGYTVERHVWVRKTWSLADSKFHPYAGAELAPILAGYEQRDSVGGAKDDDSAVGPWGWVAVLIFQL